MLNVLVSIFDIVRYIRGLVLVWLIQVDKLISLNVFLLKMSTFYIWQIIMNTSSSI